MKSLLRVFAPAVATAVACVLSAAADQTESRTSLEGDSTVAVGGVLTLRSTLDLNGHRLKYTGVTDLVGEGTFTDTTEDPSKPGELTIEVADGSTILNGTTEKASTVRRMALSGNLRFVKDGPGTLSIADAVTDGIGTHSYTAGTVVRAGTLYTTKSAQMVGDVNTPFGYHPVIDVYEGSRLDLGARGHDATTVNLRGGEITGPIKLKFADGSKMCATVNVCDSGSRIAPTKQFGIGGKLFLDSHSLEVAPLDTLEWSPAEINNGTIRLTQGALTLVGDTGMGNAVEPTASLILESGTKILGAYAYSVRDLTLGTQRANIACTFKVYGTYRLTSPEAYFPRMMGGSTLDLSELGEAVALTAANFGPGTVTIALGARPLAANQSIVSWAAKPAETAFKFEGENIVAGKSFAVSDSGIVYDAQSESVAKATWTGRGAAGDWTDPANWTCQNALGQVLDGKCPAADLSPTFTGDVASVAFDGSFPFAGARLAEAFLSSAADWTGFDLDRLTDDSILDVRGQSLALSATNGISHSAATFTNSTEKVVALDFGVADGNVFTNATLAFAGNLKFVKKGAGAFVAAKYPQEHAGVTEIASGLIRCGVRDMNANGAKGDADAKSIFGAARTVDLLAGGILDPAGAYGWAYHTINAKGGVLSNSVDCTGLATKAGSQKVFDPTGSNMEVGQAFDPTINLADDVVIHATGHFNYQGQVNANGHVLSVVVPEGKYFLWYPRDTTNLCLQIRGGGTLGVWNRAVVSYERQPGLTLKIAEGDLSLARVYSGYGPGDMSVSNYIASAAKAVNAGGGALSVRGTFTPESDYFYGCTMLDGSSIDLAGKSAAWSTVSLAENNGAVKFAEDAKVTLRLGARQLTAGERILAWTTRPVDVTFAFAGDRVDPSVPAVWGDEGLYYGYAKEPEIVWTGAAGDGDLTKGENWEGGAVPTTVKATLTGDVSALNVPVGKSFAAEKIWFREATLSRNADFSWLEIGKVSNESILDLCGHDLTLFAASGVCTNAGTVTDTSAKGGTVHFVVAENAVCTNGHFNFSGSLNFVKEGAGLLVAEKYPQVHTGAMTVRAGGVRCGEKADLNAQEGLSPFGALGAITLDEGAYLDPAGSGNWQNQTVVLNGGFISNTVARAEVGTQYQTTKFDAPFNPILDLREDARFVTTELFNFAGTIRANGHRLTIVKSCEMYLGKVRTEGAAEVEVTGGKITTLKNFAPDFSATTLVMNGAWFDFGCPLAVSNYVAMTSAVNPVYYAENWHSDAFGMTVSGAFRPVADQFFGCVLLDGATVDLRGRTTTWRTTTKLVFPYNAYGPQTVTFADHARVLVDIGTREVSSRVPVVGWTQETRPENLATLAFALNAEALKAHYRLSVRDDGLYVRRGGLVLIVR